MTTLAAAIAGVVVMRTETGQQALVDQWERTAIAFGQPVDDAAYARLEAASTAAPVYAAGMALLNGPIAAVALAAVVFAAFGGSRGGATFRQVLAVAAHASVILALRQIVGAGGTYVRETTASATTLGVWFPGFDEASPLARFLGTVDLMVVWWAVVVAIGVAVVYGRRARRVASVFIGTYVAVALLLAIVMVGMGGS